MFIPIGDDVQKRIFPIVGILLVSANVLVYIYTARLWEDSIKDINPHTFNPRTFDITTTPWYKFINQWGLVPANVAKGKTIGLATHMFLHGDFFHLLGNMLVLWAFAGSLENGLGSPKFFAFYLLWGLFAGASHALFTWGGKLPMIGASGAVAGMIGGYFVLFGALSKVKTLIFIFPRPIKVNIPAGIYVLIWLALQFAGMEVETKSGTPGVAYFAHLGGAFIGAGTMFFFRSKIHSRLELTDTGALQFKDEPAPEEYHLAGSVDESIAGAVPSAARQPSSCPHCGAALEDSHKIAERLWRCPTSSCQRLVY